MKATLDRDAMRVAYAASKSEPKRPVLEHVRIGDGEIVAADGYILARRTLGLGTTPPHGESILVPAKAIIRLLEAGAESCTITSILSDSATLESILHGDPTTILVPLLDATYPNYPKLLKSTGQKKVVMTTGFTLSVLSKVLQVCDRDAFDPRLEVVLHEPKEPQLWRPYLCDDESLEVLVMPCVILGAE